MAEENQQTEQLPKPNDIAVEAQQVDAEDVNKVALRRGKVRELVRMGYKPHQISSILKKGIKVSKNKKIIISVSKQVIQRDIEYIRQEDLAVDVDFAEKRAEILDKLDFLYNRAITEYINAKGAIRNSFMNTALAVLARITEIEGVKAPENLAIDLGVEARIAKFSAEVTKLSKDDQSTIISAVRKVLKERRHESTGDVRVPGESPGIPAQASNNEGVPGKS